MGAPTAQAGTQDRRQTTRTTVHPSRLLRSAAAMGLAVAALVALVPAAAAAQGLDSVAETGASSGAAAGTVLFGVIIAVLAGGGIYLSWKALRFRRAEDRRAAAQAPAPARPDDGQADHE